MNYFQAQVFRLGMLNLYVNGTLSPNREKAKLVAVQAKLEAGTPDSNTPAPASGDLEGRQALAKPTSNTSFSLRTSMAGAEERKVGLCHP